MEKYRVWKNENGMWEIAPRANWFMRYFGFAQVKSTAKWIWVTEFETQAEAVNIAHEIAKRDSLCFPTHLMTPRSDPRSQRLARRMRWL